MADVTPQLVSRFRALSPSELLDVDYILLGSELSEINIKKFNVDMYRQKMQCLRNGVWLNDEVFVSSKLL